MRETILKMLRRRPFVPFRLHVPVARETYDILHPEQIRVLEGSVEFRRPTRSLISLRDITRVEELIPDRPLIVDPSRD
jgi:hypothetical protein